ncbi:MAG: PAS domain S-box protein, partial [Chitinophagaceae bacterium]
QENKIVGSGIELQLTNKAGKQFWGQLTLSKVYYLGETQFTAFIKDISLQKKTAEELSVREKRFQELALHSRSVTWEVDANGLYTYVSEAAATVFGYNADELIDTFHFYDLHPANGREAFKKAALKVFEKKENFYNLTNAIQCKNGSVIWVNTNGIPMLNEQGELIGYRGSDTDITQKMLAENELHLLKQAIEASSVSFTLADATLPDMPLIYVNEAFVELTGYSKEEVLGKNCRFLHKNNEEELVLSIIKKGIEEGKNTSVTIKNYRKNGELFWNQLTISPIYNRDGILSHFVGVQKDITDRIDYFQAMMRQNQQLKEIAWMQSHVVRAPLSRMMGLIQLLDYNNFDNVEEDDLLKTPADVLKEIMNAAFELDAIIKRISEKTYEQEKMSQLA